MRGGGAFLTVIALWAQELRDGSPRVAFQTVKPWRQVFIGEDIMSLQHDIYRKVKSHETITETSSDL